MRRTRGRAPKGKPAIGTTTERLYPGMPKTASLLLAVSPEEGVMGAEYLILETTRHEHIIDLLKDVKRKMDAVDALHWGGPASLDGRDGQRAPAHTRRGQSVAA